MPLPPPGHVKLLCAEIIKALVQKTVFPEFKKAKSDLLKLARMAGTASVQSGLQTGLSSAVGAAGVSLQVGAVSIALFPIGAALGPWLGAAAIAMKASGIFALHDLKDNASGKVPGNYTCSCGKCAAGLQYLVDKKENNVAIMACSIFTVGIPLIADRLYSMYKRGKPGRPAEIHSKQFIASARGGCINAMTAILFISGDWKGDKPDPDVLCEAVAIVLAPDGWQRLKSRW